MQAVNGGVFVCCDRTMHIAPCSDLTNEIQVMKTHNFFKNAKLSKFYCRCSFIIVIALYGCFS